MISRRCVHCGRPVLLVRVYRNFDAQPERDEKGRPLTIAVEDGVPVYQIVKHEEIGQYVAVRVRDFVIEHVCSARGREQRRPLCQR